MDQQHDAGNLGMWVFLVTEIMFFGGMFMSYIVYRALHLEAFIRAATSSMCHFGATNTAVLICSSLTMALAIHAAQTGKSKSTIILLILTMLLGAAFLGIKFTSNGLTIRWKALFRACISPTTGHMRRACSYFSASTSS